jgi:c-di-GMP-binding flagellar brake protein YcgR
MDSEPFKGETIAERRRYPRFPLKLPVHFQCTEKKVNTHSENLSLGGLAVLCDHPLDTGQALNLELFIPKDAGSLESKIVCPEELCVPAAIDARVVWNTRYGDHQFILGVEFLNLHAPADVHLKKFLANYELAQPDVSF